MTDAVSKEIADIHSILATDRAAYDRDEGMQSRLRDLYDAQGSGTTLPARQQSEIAEIERIMRTNPRRYFGDEDMQRRYLTLLEGGGREPIATADASPDHGLVPVLTPSEWAKKGGDPVDYQTRFALAREVNDLLMATSEEDRAELARSFESLPVSVQAAAFAELIHRGPVASVALGEAEMKHVVTSPAWRDLAREWGGEAPGRLGRVRERLLRIVERLPEADIPRAIHWIDAAPASTMKAIGRKLAYGN